MIPKIIHHVWLGSDSPPLEHQKWIKTWKKYHPSWEFILWDNKRLASFNLFNQKEFLLCKNYSEKSDILRFEILYQYGGVYLDTDIECLKNIEPLLRNESFVTCAETEKTICSAFFATTIKHPLVEKLVKGIPQRYKQYHHENSALKFGPVYFTKIVKGKVKTLDPIFFYPYLWNAKHKKSKNSKAAFPKSYAVHHWSGSWLKKSKLDFLTYFFRSTWIKFLYLSRLKS